MSTTEFNIVKIKDEFNNFLRVKLNDDDSLTRVTASSIDFSGDDSTTKFSLSSNLSYVGTVTIGGTAKYFGEDWTIGWRGTDVGKIIFNTAPTTGTDNITVKYGITTGNGNFVYPDLPRTDLGTHSYPRIGFKVTVDSDLAGLGGGLDIPVTNDIKIQIKVVGIDTKEIDDLVTNIRTYTLEYMKNFYYWNYIKPDSIAEYDDFSDNTAQNHFKIIEFTIPNKYDILTYSAHSLGTGA